MSEQPEANVAESSLETMENTTVDKATETPEDAAEAPSEPDSASAVAEEPTTATVEEAASEATEPTAEPAAPEADAGSGESAEASLAEAGSEAAAAAAAPDDEAASAAAPEVEAVAEVAVDSAAEVSSEAAPEAAQAETKAETESPAAEAPAEDSTPPVAEQAAPEAESPDAEASAEASAKTAAAGAAKPEGASPAAVPAPPVELDEATKQRLQRQKETMEQLKKAMESKEAVEGKVIGWNRGGYHVAIGEIAAFCPVSQIEVGNPRSPKRYMDRSFPFQVIEIETGGRRVVLSRAAALKADRKIQAAQVRGKLAQGAVMKGKVSSITDFGAFVSLGGGIEGLVHVSEISRRRIEHPKEALQKGQEVEVYVLKMENNGKRIGLSMKRLEADPWKGVEERYKAGDTFSGTILRKTDFGLFVELEAGLEGLVHVSRLPLGLELSHESLQEGNEVSGWIQECLPKKRRLSLSLRETAKDDPWVGATERYPVGAVIKGTVERLAKFGAFIEVEPGLTGLLPFAEVNLSPGSNPKRRFHAGREVTVQVMSVDPSRRRLGLGSETSTAEGSIGDYKDYKKKAKTETAGMSAMAAAFAKLKS